MTMRDSQRGSPLAASHIYIRKGGARARCRNIRARRIKPGVKEGRGGRMVNGQRGNTRLRIQFRILRLVKLTGAFVRTECYFPLL